MYRGVIYFAGPKTRWSGRIDEREVISSVETPWLWLTRMHVLNTFDRLDKTCCGYAILRDGECVEQYDPPFKVAA